MNLPNSITVGRIAASPLVAILPFVDSWGARLAAFALFLVVAVSDYYDGQLARSRNLVTDLGRILDPLADKLFLVARRRLPTVGEQGVEQVEAGVGLPGGDRLARRPLRGTVPDAQRGPDADQQDDAQPRDEPRVLVPASEAQAAPASRRPNGRARATATLRRAL